MRISSSSMLEMPEMRADPSSLSLSLSLLPTEARKPRLRLCLHVPLSSGQGRERGLSSFPPSLHPSFLPHLSLARSQLVKVQMSVRPHPTWFPLTDHSVPPSSVRTRAFLLLLPASSLARPLACPFIALGFMLNAPIAKSTAAAVAATHPSLISSFRPSFLFPCPTPRGGGASPSGPSQSPPKGSLLIPDADQHAAAAAAAFASSATALAHTRPTVDRCDLL